MVSFPMIMIDKLKDDFTKMSFAKRHNLVLSINLSRPDSRTIGETKAALKGLGYRGNLSPA